MILMLPPFSHKHLDITHTTHHWPVAIPLSLHIGFPFFIYFLISICIHHACIENTTFSAPSKWFMTKMVITKPVWPTLFIFSIFFFAVFMRPQTFFAGIRTFREITKFVFMADFPVYWLLCAFVPPPLPQKFPLPMLYTGLFRLYALFLSLDWNVRLGMVSFGICPPLSHFLHGFGNWNWHLSARSIFMYVCILMVSCLGNEVCAFQYWK